MIGFGADRPLSVSKSAASKAAAPADKAAAPAGKAAAPADKAAGGHCGKVMLDFLAKV